MVVHRHNAKIAKKAENAENAGTAKNLPKQELDHRRAKSGWAAVHPPRGGFNGIRRIALAMSGMSNQQALTYSRQDLFYLP